MKIDLKDMDFTDIDHLKIIAMEMHRNKKIDDVLKNRKIVNDNNFWDDLMFDQKNLKLK